MKTADYPVKMYCPISNVYENVYFHPVEIDGKWYVSIDSFNGCDHSWHACQECEACKKAAYDKINSTTE